MNEILVLYDKSAQEYVFLNQKEIYLDTACMKGIIRFGDIWLKSSICSRCLEYKGMLLKVLNKESYRE